MREIDEMFNAVIEDEEEFTITKGGKDVAVVLPVETYRELKRQALAGTTDTDH